MLKAAQLKTKSFDELVEIAMWQVARVNEIRGYSSGLTAKHMAIFDYDELVDLIVKEDRTFKLGTKVS